MTRSDGGREDELLEEMYATHHRREQSGGERLGQAFLETTRAKVFSSWIGRDKDVLDLGCRDGTLTRHFVAGNRIVGVDIDSAALAIAHEAYDIEVRRANLNARLPCRDASFDVAVLAETLEHLPYPLVTLAEIRRVLRGGGSSSAASPSSITCMLGGGLFEANGWITIRRTVSIIHTTR
jgi:ubiquinone/menaquinone biosynthesis C-methylase UbiE